MLSAFGVDHGISKAFERTKAMGQKQYEPVGAGVAGGLVAAGGYAARGAVRDLKGVNQKVRSDRAAGQRVTRGMAGSARAGGLVGGAAGRVLGKPGKTALIAGAAGLGVGGASAMNNRRLRRQ